MGNRECDIKDFCTSLSFFVCRSICRCCWWSRSRFLVWLRAHAAMGSSSFFMSLSGLGVGLGKAFCTLGDGAVITVALVDGILSGSVYSGSIDYVIGTLVYMCVLSSSYVCVKCGFFK